MDINSIKTKNKTKIMEKNYKQLMKFTKKD